MCLLDLLKGREIELELENFNGNTNFKHIGFWLFISAAVNPLKSSSESKLL